MPRPLTLSISMHPEAIAWLAALYRCSWHADPALGQRDAATAILAELAQAAATGASRPGSWEARWIRQVIPLECQPRAPEGP